MSEFGDTPTGADFTPQQDLRETLSRTLPGFNQSIRAAGINTSRDPVSIEQAGASARNTENVFDTGFGFWGVLRDSFAGVHSPTAIINDIKVPEKQRGKGVGSTILAAWETEMQAAGVRNFGATTIKAINPDGTPNTDAIKFWEKHGYTPWGNVKDGIPYAMVKEVPSAT